MNFLEKNLEDIIYETDNSILQERGLPIDGRKLKQVKMKSYGVADIITFKRISEGNINCEITIYELKKEFVSSDTFIQAVRYAIGIKHHLKQRNSTLNPQFKIVLIGKRIYHEKMTIINDFFEIISVYQYDYKHDGIVFKSLDELTN